MRKIIILLLILPFFISSCIKDGSTMLYPQNNPNYSNITVTSTTATLSVDQGTNLVFTPTVTQTIPSKELQYFWTANKVINGAYAPQIVCGEGPTLDYAFPELGTYILRLEVKNEDNSFFKTWNVSVRANDEGFLVAGENENGEVSFAFARKLSETDIEEGKELTFATDIIAKINPGIKIKNLVKMYKSKSNSAPAAPSYLYIFTRDKIYVANQQTFEIFNISDFTAAYPGDGIESVKIMDEGNSQALITTIKKKVVMYAKNEFASYDQDYTVYPKFDRAYCDLNQRAGKNAYSMVAFVNNQKSTISVRTSTSSYAYVDNTQIATGAGPTIKYTENAFPNIYDGRNIVNVSKMNGNSSGTNRLNYYAIATDKANPRDVLISCFAPLSSGRINPLYTGTYIATEDINVTKDTQIIPNARYNSMYYASGSEIFVWYPNQSEPKLPTTSAINLGAGKEVTCMEISYDMRQLYVGFYDKNYSGTYKGGFYVYDASKIGTTPDIQPIEGMKFEGITYKPVQVSYKTYPPSTVIFFEDVL